VPIYAPGVTLGISRKMKEEPGRIVDNRLNRPVKWTWSRIIGKYGHLSGLRSVNQALACSARVLIIEQFGKWKDSNLKRVLG